MANSGGEREQHRAHDSKNIVKIVHVTSVVQPYFYDATRIPFVHKEKK